MHQYADVLSPTSTFNRSVIKAKFLLFLRWAWWCFDWRADAIQTLL